MFFSQLIFAVVLVAVVTLFDFSESFLPKDLADLLYSDSVEEKRSEALDDLESAYEQKEAKASEKKSEEEKKPEATKPEATKSETAKSEATKPEATKPEEKPEKKKEEQVVATPKSGASNFSQRLQNKEEKERVNFAKSGDSKPTSRSADLSELVSRVSNNIYKE